jgi:HYR domain/Secretion system C-terminal sorting domain
MKPNYFVLTLCLLFLVNAGCFAGGTTCIGNTAPQIQLVPACSTPITAQVGVPLIIGGMITDTDIADQIILNLGPGSLPTGATTTPLLPAQGNPIPFTFVWTPSSEQAGIPVTLIFIATDLCGANTVCTYVVNVVCSDLTITCPSTITTTAGPAGGACGAIVNYTVTASSTSGIDDLTVTPASGSTFPIGKSTVTATATDVCGGTATCSFDVIVNSAAPPTVTCPANVTTPPTSPSGAVVTYIASASSPIGLSDFTATPPSGSTFPFGTTTVVATATDVCDNTSTCSFTVTVGCGDPPTITCPTSFTVTTGECNATLSFNVAATGTGVVVTYVPPPMSVYQVGTTTVTATATDACGNTATCSFPVTVIGPEPPDIQCPANITVPVSAGSCSAVVNYFLTVFDEDEVDNDLTSSPPSGSTFPVGTTTVRASVTDECGNSDTCSFTVTVTNNLSVDAGPDVSTVFGYPSTQTVTRTALASGGTGPYSYRWTLNRALKCNQVNSSGDELFTGGTCTNNICPGSGSVTAAAPACTGNATINATLLADATACVTVTDANGCTATECFEIAAVDGRCFSGTSGKKKTKVCHRTGSASNPWIQICVDKGALAAHLSHNPDDKVGPCPSGASRTALMEEDETFLLYPNPVASELTLDFGTEAIRSVQLFNAMGKLLFETTSDWEQLKMDMTGFAKGIYFISVRDEDNTVTVKKFVMM